MKDTEPTDSTARQPKRTAIQPWFALAERQSHALARLLAVNAGYAKYFAQVAGVVGRAAIEQAEHLGKAARSWSPAAPNGSSTPTPIAPRVSKPRVVPSVRPDVTEADPVAPEAVEPEASEPVAVEPEATEPEAETLSKSAPEPEPGLVPAQITEPDVQTLATPPLADDQDDEQADDVEEARRAARERYVGKRKADLVKEAADRGLPKYGTIAQLVDRLVSDDTQ